MTRPWLVLLLCLATVFNGVAAAATVPVAAAAPCEMGADHDSGGNSPCADCGDSNAACLQQCEALCASVLVAEPAFSVSRNVPAGRIGVGAAALFASHAGPPGFQPPR